MMKIMASMFVIMMSMCCPQLVGAAEGLAAVGKVSYAYGDTFVERKGEKVKIKGGQQVHRNDILTTGHHARLKLTMDDDSYIYMGPNSRMGFKSYDVWGKRLVEGSVDFYWGQIQLLVRKMSDAKASFMVRTKTMVIGVRGTEFLVIGERPEGVADDVAFADLPEHPVRTVLIEGKVDITAPSGEVYPLQSGHTAEILDTDDNAVHIRPSLKHDSLSQAQLSLHHAQAGDDEAHQAAAMSAAGLMGSADQQSMTTVLQNEAAVKQNGPQMTFVLQ